jgi:Clostripain family
MPQKAKWTVLTYIAAHNNLDVLGKKSLHEILGVGSTDDVMHGVLYDGLAGAGRYVMGEPGFVKDKEQEQLGASFDSGDPDELIATAKWLFQKYPAERYGLVLWSHGSGWEPNEIETIANEVRPEPKINAAERQERAAAPASRCLFRSTLRAILKPQNRAERAILFDDGTGHSLDTLELARVAQTISEFIGQPLDLLGMDACLMANLEVAYEVRKVVRYLVASEELVPGHSWPYAEIFGGLRANPDQSGVEFASFVVDRYVSFYTAHPPAAGDVTKVALDLSRIEDLALATDSLARALNHDMDKAAAAMWQVQRSTQQRETNKGKRSPNKFDYYLWDIRSLAAGLVGCDTAPDSVRETARSTVQALAASAACVLAEGHRGTWFDEIGGVSAYLMPPKQQRVSPSYAKLAFAKDTQWDEMLHAYHEYFD